MEKEVTCVTFSLIGEHMGHMILVNSEEQDQCKDEILGSHIADILSSLSVRKVLGSWPLPLGFPDMGRPGNVIIMAADVLAPNGTQ